MVLRKLAPLMSSSYPSVIIPPQHQEPSVASSIGLTYKVTSHVASYPRVS